MDFLRSSALNGIILYGTISSKLYLNTRRLYDTNVVFRYLTNTYFNIFNGVRFMLYPRKVESEGDWIHTVELIKNRHTGTYTLKEYKYDTTSVELDELYNNILIYGKTTIGNSAAIMKIDGLYIVRNVLTDYSELVTTRSNVRFLTVEYTHPEMSVSIYLETPRNYFVVGNELFSSAFVLRCLEYQSERYIFDEKYVVNVVDNDIKPFSLKSDQYVVIGMDGYEVAGQR